VIRTGPGKNPADGEPCARALQSLSHPPCAPYYIRESPMKQRSLFYTPGGVNVRASAPSLQASTMRSTAVIAEGDTVILTEHDSNDRKIRA
jgi:hypothetical protein